jgi:cysteinyl-tRNA synthetase
LNELANADKSGTEIEDGKIAAWKKSFEEAMDSDFNTANVLALLFEIFKFSNANIVSLSSGSAKKINALLKDIFAVLGFDKIGEKRETINLSFKGDLIKVLESLKKNPELEGKLSAISFDKDAPEILKDILDIRFEFRKQKRFDISDLIRDELKKIGVVLEDSKEGTKYKLVMTDEGK